MNPHLLYAVIDGAHIAFLLVLAIRLLALAPRNRNVRLIGLLALSTVCMVVSARHSYMAVLPAGFAVDLGPAIIPMNFARNLGSGLVMVLCHSVFRDEERFALAAVGGLGRADVARGAARVDRVVRMGAGAAAGELRALRGRPVCAPDRHARVRSRLGHCANPAPTWWRRAGRPGSVLVVVTVAHIVLTVLVERLALLIWVLPTDVYFGVHSGITTFGLLLSGTVVLLLLRPDGRTIRPIRYARRSVATAADPSRHAYDVARNPGRGSSPSGFVPAQGSHHRRAGAEHLKLPEYRLRIPDPRRPGAIATSTRCCTSTSRGGGQRSAGRSRPGRRTRAHVGPVGRLRLDLAVQPGVPGAQGDDADPVPAPAVGRSWPIPEKSGRFPENDHRFEDSPRQPGPPTSSFAPTTAPGGAKEV